ncbi:hypothetical protein STCU_12246 [Strigomonas culicis]|uniref:Uncharacterized protein n=1 Tax=Strigomonas culicis TaxID=28005 RepID=S9TE27_9TRYP|nr:hypothetical protein STCU_12246 [Strigomonas culicis]|eukprot:EPY15209.1 hypothetical protein STCU_12246 [Strigomonas culicis]
MFAILMYGAFIEHIHKYCGLLYIALRLASPIRDVPSRVLCLRERLIFLENPTLASFFHSWEPFTLQDGIRRKRLIALFGIETVRRSVVFQTPRTIALLFMLIQTCAIAFSSYTYTLLCLTSVLQTYFLGDGFLLDEAVEWRLSLCHFAECMAEEYLTHCFSFEYKNAAQHYYDDFRCDSALRPKEELGSALYNVPVHLFLELYRVKLIFDKYGLYTKDEFSPVQLFWQRFVAAVRVTSISLPTEEANEAQGRTDEGEGDERGINALLLDLMPLVELEVQACDTKQVPHGSHIAAEDRGYARVLGTARYIVHRVFPWARLHAQSRQEEDRLLSESELGVLGVEFCASLKRKHGSAAIGVPIDVHCMRAVALTPSIRRKVAVFALILTLLQVPHLKDSQTGGAYTLARLELLSATFLLASGPSLERSGSGLMVAVAHMRQIEKLVNVFRHNLYGAIRKGARKEQMEDAFTSASVPKLLNLFKDV